MAHPSAAASAATAGAPAPLHVYITRNMQAFYARRGMWRNGSPQGALTGMLGPLVPLLSNDHRQAFYVTAEQLAALAADISRVPEGAMRGNQRAQFLRRLREAAGRASLVLPAQPGQPLRAAASCHTVPFTALQAPTHGKAAALFSEHVMRTVRDFVDFTQTTAYGSQA